jgi:23S rRNA (cytosine1962-C5)-methyltransferase
MTQHPSRPLHHAPIPYALIDSGGQQKLERFGDKTLVRPSTVSVWRQRLQKHVWSRADATYDPDSGWRFRDQPFEVWRIEGALCTLALRLQTNGQIGVFPEHAGYLPDLVATIERLRAHRSTPVAVLNLFAYTGMASVVAARSGALVTHVDLSKRALDWARENIGINGIPEGSVRLIPEDALGYLARLAKKGQRFDIIIADPPSFSRVTPKKTWSLDEVTPTLIELLVQTLEPGHGELFLSSHHFEIGAHTFANLLSDHLGERRAETAISPLALREDTTERILPAGFLIRMTLR